MKTLSMGRKWFYAGSLVATAGAALAGLAWRPALWAFLLIAPLVLLGFLDMLQREHAVRRNFPLIGRLRYLFEAIRPEISQYFIESNTDGTPFSREARSLVYQRSKGALDTLPFGTQRDVYAPGYEWISHSLAARAPSEHDPRVRVGGPHCQRPYQASLLNVSAMSFGALGRNAILALNEGARRGGFAHNTGEGGISPYHLQPGGDLIWQVGTGYFGCRTPDGDFDPEAFAHGARQEAVKMIELKLSQGAKPGHGGILPGRKVTPEIAAIRGVPVGRDVISPPAHRAFRTPRELCQFVGRLRELSGGKPIGIKLCVGRGVEFMGLCKAMIETGQAPDYVCVDGGEGGTGAAPLEFSNSVGMPLREGLVFVHSVLVGAGLRPHVRVAAAGKVTSGFRLARLLALGADLCFAARPMMLALGCIQARRCNQNSCPVGVATQDAALERGLVVAEKAERVERFHRQTVESLMELLGAAGLERPEDLTPAHLLHRVDEITVRTFEEIYDFLEPGELIENPPSSWVGRLWERADPDDFSGVAVEGARPAF